MGTVIRAEISANNRYWVEKHRYYELKHFCFQYPEWKKKYLSIDGLGARACYGSELVTGGTMADPTATHAEARLYYCAYRGRVTERFGEDVERELRNNLQKAEIEEAIVDDKGKTKKVKREIRVANGMPSDYARYFTYPEAKAAEPNMAYNQFFLRTQQTLANTLLRSRYSCSIADNNDPR